jgi:signal transduction histidine kinase
MTRTVPLRRRLLLLAAVAILPLALMAGAAVYALARQQSAQMERATLELARALATGIDAELRRSISVLEAMATSTLLDKGDLRAYYAVARRVASTQPHWVAIIVSEPSGRQLLNTRFGYGDALPKIVEPASFERVVRTRSPAVGSLAKGLKGEQYFTVRAPVMREGELRWVLTAVVKPEMIREVIKRQRVPDDWVISVFDANGARVARSRMHYETLGAPASPSLQRLMAGEAREGVGPTEALEGDEVYSAFSRLPDSGWSVVPGIPAGLVSDAVRHSLIAYGSGLLLSIALGIAAALLIGRRIARPIAEMGRGAPALTDIREIRDVAESLRAAAAEREELLRRERDARAAAEGANRAKDEFLAMLGHELRNPLGAIANAARILEHPRTDAEAAGRAREIISRQTDHLSRLTDDLLDAGRAVMGKISLQRQPLELAALTAASLATLKSAGRTANHRVVQNLEPVWVDGDPIRLEQILANLVVNAAKFTPLPGTIRVSVRRENGEAVLRVADDGIGMAADLAARAFDLFVQGERGLDRTMGGLGIGLTLVRRLAEMHGGSAAAASDGAGKGSQITVRLPAIEPPPPPPARAPQASPSLRRSILVIEDNDDARESLRRLLELAGHRVSGAADGAAGLAAALVGKPEVLLVDVGLPKMDGYEVARRIRAAAGDWRPFLVALTGYGLPEDRARAFDAGFDAHLVKPVDHAALEALLSAPR